MHKILMACVLAFALTGCAASSDDVTINSYKALQTSATIYDTLMLSAADLHGDGIITDEQYDKIKDAAQVYYDAYQAAVDALLVYIESSQKDGKDKLLSYVDLAKANLNILLTIAEGCGIDLSALGNFSTAPSETSEEAAPVADAA